MRRKGARRVLITETRSTGKGRRSSPPLRVPSPLFLSLLCALPLPPRSPLLCDAFPGRSTVEACGLKRGEEPESDVIRDACLFLHCSSFFSRFRSPRVSVFAKLSLIAKWINACVPVPWVLVSLRSFSQFHARRPGSVLASVAIRTWARRVQSEASLCFEPLWSRLWTFQEDEGQPVRARQAHWSCQCLLRRQTYCLGWL